MSRGNFSSRLNTNVLSRLWTTSPQLTPPNPHSSPWRLPEEICLYSVNAVQRGSSSSSLPFLLSFWWRGYFFVICFMHSRHQILDFLYPLQGSVNSVGGSWAPPLPAVQIQEQRVGEHGMTSICAIDYYFIFWIIILSWKTLHTLPLALLGSNPHSCRSLH